MDVDACPTTWDELLRIRAENPNYNVNAAAMEAQLARVSCPQSQGFPQCAALRRITRAEGSGR